MRMLRFSRLCLLSQHERLAFRASFPSEKIVLLAPNGFGKSAVLKSLYDALGAEPHKIDREWRTARVETLLQFTVDGVPYTILKGNERFAIFDGADKLLLRTTSIGKDLTAYLAKLLDFQLEMVDKKDEVITPPPAYMFAPFYIDQDRSWGEPWVSFRGIYLNNSKQTLAEYHSGLKPNAYYGAQTERNLLQKQRRELEAEREVFHQTMQNMQSLVSDVVLSFDLSDFQQESDELLEESRKLHAEQLDYRQKLSDIADERRLWLEQRDLVKAALAEMDEAFAAALEKPSEVSCPTCGQHYDNSIADQFEIVQDKDGLFNSLIISQDKLHELEAKAQAERGNIATIEKRLVTINHLLSTQKAEISFRDIIAVQGRNEAARMIRSRVNEIDTDIGRKFREAQIASERMRAAVSRARTREIRDYFTERLVAFTGHLSVRFDASRRPSMTSMPFARGSAGPRGIIAYYYAFLHTAREYSSSAFGPIVIDEPNQQGQGDMPTVIRFIFDQKPHDSQVIVATHDLYGLTDKDATIVNVGKRENQLLDEDNYDEVSDIFRPYLGQLI